MRLDYVTCIGEYFPNVCVVCLGDPNTYTDITWISGDPLPSQAELDLKIFEQVRDDKVAAMSKACQEEIIHGFRSSALGYECIYDSEEVDQINITGVFTMISPTIEHPNGTESIYAVRPVIGGVVQPKVYVNHTFPQLRAALVDGGNFKLELLQRFNDKRDIINSLTTIAEIDAITWEQ